MGPWSSCPHGLPRRLQHPQALAAPVSQDDEWLENSVLEMFVPVYMEICELTNRCQKDRNSNRLWSGRVASPSATGKYWERLKSKDGVTSLCPWYSLQLLKIISHSFFCFHPLWGPGGFTRWVVPWGLGAAGMSFPWDCAPGGHAVLQSVSRPHSCWGHKSSVSTTLSPFLKLKQSSERSVHLQIQFEQLGRLKSVVGWD